jgi:hypothetical protein
MQILPPLKPTNLEEDGCENSVDCLTQPLQPNDLVLLKLVTNKRWNILLRWSRKLGLMVYNTTILKKRLTYWTFCFPEIDDNALIYTSVDVLKLSYPVVSESARRIVAIIFGKNLSDYNIN